MSEDVILSRKKALHALRTHPVERHAVSMLRDLVTGRTCAIGTMAEALDVPDEEMHYTDDAMEELARLMNAPYSLLKQVPYWNDKDLLSESEIADRLEQQLDGEPA